MGYNTFGNILFYGLGMYLCASVQVGMFFPLAEWTESGGEKTFVHTPSQFFQGMAAGLVVAAMFVDVTSSFDTQPTPNGIYQITCFRTSCKLLTRFSWRASSKIVASSACPPESRCDFDCSSCVLFQLPNMDRGIRIRSWAVVTLRRQPTLAKL